jgi:hypothetical protein
MAVTKVTSSMGVVGELRRVLGDAPYRGIVVVGLDNDGICGVAVNPRHRSLSWVKVWELADLGNEMGACALMVMVFPDGRAPRPSAHEFAVFADLAVRARRAGLLLNDSFVWRGDRMWSLREMHEAAFDA